MPFWPSAAPRGKPKPPEHTKGVMRCFSQLAASPMKGAYLDYDAD